MELAKDIVLVLLGAVVGAIAPIIISRYTSNIFKITDTIIPAIWKWGLTAISIIGPAYFIIKITRDQVYVTKFFILKIVFFSIVLLISIVFALFELVTHSVQKRIKKEQEEQKRK
jgi:hypothetical protein